MRKVDKRQALETVERLYPQGWGLREIASLIGVSHERVRAYVAMCGICLRRRGRIVNIKSLHVETTPLN